LKRKTITFVISNLGSGGAQRVLFAIANSLIINYNIVIISLYSDAAFYDYDDRIKIRFCSKTYNNNPSVFQSLLSQFKLFKTTKRFIKEEKSDVIIGFMITSNIYVSLISKFTGTPSIISERNNPYSSDNNKFWLKMRRFSYPFASFLVVQTQAAKDYFKTFLKSDQLEIIRNPIAPEFKLAAKTSVQKENIILNVGRLIASKNQDLLIKAFSNISSENWKLVLVGDGNKREEYETLAHSLGIKNKVEFTGNVTNVADYYKKSKIFAFTSKTEGFPNALTEAMFFGLACISTDCPSGPSELIDDGKNGYLIPMSDEALLSQKLTILMNDELLVKEFGLKAKETTSQFDINTITNHWKSLVDLLVSHE
jgi:GalNAc-alpha-(1->4)-GalNAc-alpha-(1->3)-diNAcBac-PP-undecaprenol alpha-1,4-N-acetyl-D-galactosaminyltransferase